MPVDHDQSRHDPDPATARRGSWSISVKLAVFVGVLVALVAAAVAVPSYLFVRELMLRQVRERLSAETADACERVRTYVDQQRERLALVASRTRLRDLVRLRLDDEIQQEDFLEQSGRILRDVVASSRGFGSVWIVDASGRPLTWTDPATASQDYASDAAFVRGREGIAFGLPQRSGAGLEATLAGPVVGGGSRLLGVVMVRLDVTPFADSLARMGADRRSFAIVVGAAENDHIRSVFPAPGEPTGGDAGVGASAMLTAAIAGQTGLSAGRDGAGTEVLGAYRPVGYEDWGLVSKIDSAEAYGPIVRFGWLAGTVGVCILGVALAAAWAIAARATRPVLELCLSADAIAAGDLSVRTTVSSRDELGALSAAFNGMAASLEKHRDHLEERVRERTHELVRSQSDLRAARDTAHRANRAKDEFLAHMSHEIRTPLNGVIGMLDLLLGTELTERQARFARLARTSGQSLTTVINDILDLSKIEAGKLEVVASEFDLHVAVEEIVEMLAPRAVAKGLEIACHIAPEVPRLARGDSDRIRQVLVNLVTNAVKFTERGSVVVRLTLQSRELSAATVRFSVTDTGIGIAQDRLDRLFRAFSQADASTTRTYGGTGLGLAIAKKLAELMGGAVGVETEVGRGSTFWFTVVLEAREPVAGTMARPQVDPSGMRILAVDDSDIQREVLRQQIASWGLEAATAPDGEHALRMLSEAAATAAPFRVAIVDSDMPGMDGFELAQAVRARENIRETVLMILLSADADIGADQLRRMGFAGHMTKPVRQSELFNAIMHAVASAGHPRLTPGPAPGRSSRASGPLGASIALGAGVLRILLAEDNEINQIVATEILTNAGHRCDVVPDGRGAVEAAEREPYDVILMDCQMPVMDGFEATRQIRLAEKEGRSSSRGRHIPIIALTADAMEGDRERCLQAGMDAYASKPIDAARILQTISSVLRPVGIGDSAR
jgi:signal transduction histidine kinase/CheY-like chemotaxis protein